MPRSSSTARTEKLGAVRKTTGRRKPAAGKHGDQENAVPQALPVLPIALKPCAFDEVDDELDGEHAMDHAVPSVQCSLEARKRIEILREERLLQQALFDTFDL